MNLTEEDKLEEKELETLKIGKDMLIILKQKKKRNIDLIKV